MVQIPSQLRKESVKLAVRGSSLGSILNGVHFVFFVFTEKNPWCQYWHYCQFCLVREKKCIKNGKSLNLLLCELSMSVYTDVGFEIPTHKNQSFYNLCRLEMSICSYDILQMLNSKWYNPDSITTSLQKKTKMNWIWFISWLGSTWDCTLQQINVHLKLSDKWIRNHQFPHYFVV